MDNSLCVSLYFHRVAHDVDDDDDSSGSDDNNTKCVIETSARIVRRDQREKERERHTHTHIYTFTQSPRDPKVSMSASDR